MSAEANTRRAQDGYAAFGRGDLPAVLAMLADDIEWVTPGPPDILPNAGTSRGKDAVAAWFGTLAENVEFQTFEPREFIAQGDRVVSLVYVELTVRSTGRQVKQHEVHVWRFAADKLAHFEAFEDTAAMVAAYQQG
jgi:uncharacterized protein